ncbi:FtsX-like permease family protein [Anaerolineales bacterium HSG24]|nr:FtsX-like permease family protein [Anaerolineales bacterium HSG24]
MMIGPRWRKLFRDLWLNRARTILVVLSIAVGVFAVGVIASSRTILSTQLNEAYTSINPASAFILTFTPFDEDVVEAVEKMREVSAADARRMITVRVKVGEDEWQSLQLNAIDDYDDIEVDKVAPGIGKWPPDEQEMLIERSAFHLIQAEIGDVLTIKDPNGKERQITLVGTAHDLYAQMFTMSGMAYGYITFDTLEWFGEPRDFNDLRFTVAKNGDDREHIKLITNLVQDKLEASGATIWFAAIPIPGQHPMNFIIQPILALLGVLSVLALILSLFLVINMISALLTQQQKQIGIMKAVGARTRQIIILYYTGVLIFGGLSLLIAVPLGAVGSYLLSQGLANSLNFDIDRIYLPQETLLLQIGLGLIVPVLAATYPIVRGTQVTVQEAISGYGLGKGKFGTNLIDRLLVNLYAGFLARPTIISLRNTFRRKGRLMLTLLTLVMAGAIFISVFTIQASLQNTLNALLEYFQYDVAIQFTRPYRVEQLKRDILPVEGVENVEGWCFGNVRRIRPDGTESDNIITLSPPADTKLVKPTVIEGRWLRPDDTNAVVINTLMINDEPDIKVGSEIILKIRDKEMKWQVVGIVLGGGVMGTLFTNYDYFSKVSRKIGKSEWAFIQTTDKSPEFRKKVLTHLERYMADDGYRIGMGITVDEDIQSMKTMFAVIVGLMLSMAVLLAVVGGLGLMGTMSINVLERTREVGVIRAIGASDIAVLQIVLIEGVLIGIISWVISILIALPISKVISDLIGRQFLGAELAFTFSITGVLLWLVMVIVLASIASFLPAWSASRLTVREVLAYEG